MWLGAVQGLCALIVASACIGPPKPGMAASVSVTVPQAKAEAWRALQQRNYYLVENITAALLQRDPNDFEALLLASEAARGVGETEYALRTGKRAYRAAPGKRYEYDASVAVSRAYEAKGNPGFSSFWIRRAIQNAPNNLARNYAIRDLQRIRRHSDSSIQFVLNAFPSSNINGGTDATVAPDLLGLGTGVILPTALPHSGYGLSAAVDYKHKHRLGPQSLVLFGASAFGTAYRLSAQAKSLGSGLNGSDFSFLGAEGTVQLIFPRAPNPRQAIQTGATQVGATFGFVYYGGKPLTVYSRLSAAQSIGLGNATSLEFKTSLGRQRRLDDAVLSATVTSVQARLFQNLGNGDRITWSLQLKDTNSASPAIANKSVKTDFTYHWTKGLGGVVPSFGLGFEHRQDDRDIGIVSAKTYDTATAHLSLLFPSIQYYGFSPILSLTARKTVSSFSLNNSTEFRANIGFRSTF